MATYSLANERLRALEDIEREIGAILQNAGPGGEERSSGSQGRAGVRARRGRDLSAGLGAGLRGQPPPNAALSPPWQERRSWNCPRKKPTSAC